MPPDTVAIGLEVHARVKTRSKAFCSCPVAEHAAPNASTCPICLGLPGTLPILNRALVEAGIRTGLAMSCTIHARSWFSRKYYFYPDLPKGFQISQHTHPLCTGGYLLFRNGSNRIRELPLRRIHMEEDAGKLLHEKDRTLIDFNRAGVPLLEIVTTPSLRNPDDAVHAFKALRQLLMYLDVCDGKMEQGALRCDVNVSLDPLGSERTEIKNLNSFRAMEEALQWEISRQMNMRAKGEELFSTTMQWDADAGRCNVMRAKEAEFEYRFALEPDLPPIDVSEEMLQSIRASLPETPLHREERFRSCFGLSQTDVLSLTAEREVADYYEQVLDALDVHTVDIRQSTAHWVLGDVRRILHERTIGIEQFPCAPARLAVLIGMVYDEELSVTAARNVFECMLAENCEASAAAKKLGVTRMMHESEIAPIIDQVVTAHSEQAMSWLSGKERALNFLMGKVMRGSGAAVPPAKARSMLISAIRKHYQREGNDS